MPSKANLSGTTLPRRQLGRALRDARHTRGTTLDQVAADTEFSRATLSRIELGQYEKIKVREVEYLCQYYGMDRERVEYLMMLAAQSNTKIWWQNYQHFLHEGFISYLELEGYATEFRFFQPLMVPGLLQTAEYARAIYGASSPDAPESEVGKWVEMRMQRRTKIAQRHRKIRLEFLLHENALHTVVGSRRAMGAQCRHIADVSTQENVVIRVIPFTAGIPTGHVVPPFIVLDFPDAEPAVVHSEGAIGSMTFEDADDVVRFRSLYETLRSATLDEVRSRDRIRQMARSFDQ